MHLVEDRRDIQKGTYHHICDRMWFVADRQCSNFIFEDSHLCSLATIGGDRICDNDTVHILRSITFQIAYVWLVSIIRRPSSQSDI